MRKLNEPNENNVSDIFKDCINGFTKGREKKEKLEKCVPYIVKKEKEYKKLIKQKKLYTILDKICEEMDVTKEELISVYDEKFVPKSSPGRSIYNQLMKGTRNRTCPICSQRKVSTLDHYLAKTKYPSFVVSPINLIPACSECNKTKSADKAEEHITETIHPYFDDLGNERYLFMDVNENIEDENDIILSFTIKKASNWDTDLYLRVENHFNKFNLNDLYISHAIDEIISQIDMWRDLNSEDLKKQLCELAGSAKKLGINSWKVALYEGLGNNEWFYTKGYKTIYLDEESW